MHSSNNSNDNDIITNTKIVSSIRFDIDFSGKNTRIAVLRTKYVVLWASKVILYIA